MPPRTVQLIWFLALTGFSGCQPAPSKTPSTPASVQIAYHVEGARVSGSPAFDGGPVGIHLSWSTQPDPTAGPLRPISMIADPRGALHLLASRDQRYGLYKTIGDRGPAKATPIRPDMWISAVAAPDGRLWMVGRGPTITSFPDVQTEALVGKLDPSGRELWSKGFGADKGSFRLASDAVLLPPGDLVVAGRDGRTAWLARISQDGKLIWDRKFGLDRDVAVVSIGDDILVASSELAEDTLQHREDVTLRRYGADGTLKARFVVREAINLRRSADFAEVQLMRDGERIYLLSAYVDPLDPKPYELAKLGPSGRVLWRRELPSTVRLADNGRSSICRTRMVVLADGSPLVACQYGDRLDLLHMTTANGAFTLTNAQLPACHRPGGEVFLFAGPDRQVTVAGGPPDFPDPTGSTDRSCTWLGRLTNG